MEMKLEEGSEDLDTVWIGYCKMLYATIKRTYPNLENAGQTALEDTSISFVISFLDSILIIIFHSFVSLSFTA